MDHSTADDHALLRQYVEHGSQPAFAQLVRRHAGLVHSAALRQTRDRHLAEDASQAVFLLLARRAHRLGPNVILTGWLYNTARYAGAAARRAADRRRRHEQRASQHMTPTTPPTSPLTWSDVEPAVDDAMSRLRHADRTALLLRYFENKPLRDVAATLDLSEDAAKQRCLRALDKLRRLLRLSSTPTAPALEALLSNHAVTSPPEQVVAAASALSIAAAPPSVALLAKGTLHMMLRAKLKLALTSAVAVTLALGGAQLALTRAQAVSPAGKPATSPAAFAPPAKPAPVTTAAPTKPVPVTANRPLVLPSQVPAGSPRAVFYEAYAAGIMADVTQLRDLVLLDAEDARRLERPIAAQAVFTTALKTKFPDAPGLFDNQVSAATARFVAVQMKGLTNFVEDTAGDDCTLRQPNGFDFVFRKIDGQWKWDLTRKPALEADPKFKRATGQARVRLVYSMTKLADIYDAATQKLAAGGYGSRFAALADVRGQFLATIQETPPELRNQNQAPLNPLVAIQTEDYAAVRTRFHTKLLKSIPAPDPTPGPLPPTPANTLLVDYPTGDLRLKAWLFSPPTTATPTKHPALLHLHGGFSLHPERWAATQMFRDAGFVVLMPSLRGEHGQPGSFSFGYDEVDDVLAAAAYLKTRPDVDPDRIFVLGYGDSATIALLAAEASPAFRAASAISGFHDLLLLSKHSRAADLEHLPFDPADPHEFEVRSPLAYAASLKCPARLFHCAAEPYLTAVDQRFADLAKEHGLDVTTTLVPLPPKEAALESLRQTLTFFQECLN